jgi:UDP-N-acetylglucosamine--N-acetylmuramyl-(pentapeptide) pyrophosphoryl-undecaprenol N-acetylglucosamine transferase
LIVAGGTGGHVYPALAIAEATLKHHPEAELTFVGNGGIEQSLVGQSGLKFAAYHDVRGGPLHGVSWGRRLISAANLLIGTAQSIGLMMRHKPKALLSTGGWGGLPMALAAWLFRVPMLIYLPDIEPGLTIRVLSRFARRVAVTAEESLAFFRPGQAVVTGYPVREGMTTAARDQAFAHFNLDPARKTLLVFGGSLGARSINSALFEILPQLLADGFQVTHITGKLDWPRAEAMQKTLAQPEHYHAYAYLHHEMGLALAAADLVVSRAGASVLGEFPLFDLPSILVPYPYAWRYQKVNADYLAERGAAVRMDDERMGQDLLPTLRSLLNDPVKLAEMRANARALARPNGAERAAAELMRLAGGAA